MMIVARVFGGLGNQMFQYAAARSLSLRRDVELRLDTRDFGVHARRCYELANFPIVATEAAEAELARFGLGGKPVAARRLRRLRRLLRFVRPSGDWPVYHEPHFHYDAKMRAMAAPIYLDGHWQSERYFSEHADLLRRELTPRGELEVENAEIAAQVESVQAVSLHVRRGDYVSDRRTNRYHGTCSIDYYQRAVEYIGRHVDRPHLFVFSDDQQWARCHLRFSLPMTFVGANPADRGFRDMQLMARCRHHVVANSSFSWWGAWLDPSPDKIVVAPKRWFNVDGIDTRDLVPADWVRL